MRKNFTLVFRSTLTSKPVYRGYLYFLKECRSKIRNREVFDICSECFLQYSVLQEGYFEGKNSFKELPTELEEATL